jgi:hypothetical protein
MRKVNLNEIEEERGSRPAGNTPYRSKEFRKHSGANRLRSIWPSDIHSIWNGTGCLPGNAITRTTRTNSGTEDFIFYVIADNPIGESSYEPDSGKWKVNKSSAADRVVLKGKETDWFDGEE